MAEDSDHHERLTPAVVTLRPDNFLTIGLIVLIAYTATVIAAQLAMRWKRPAATP
jgi:hypothetical protein